jgi:membrane AbrB-like protein
VTEQPSPPPDAYLRTLLLCLLAGGLLTALGLPLGWMIGSLVATGYLALRGAAAVPALARPAGLVVLGLSMGQGFTPPVMDAVAAALPAMLAGGVVALLAAVAVAPLFRRLARSDDRTAFFACMPGGVVNMAVLAGRAGGAVSVVTAAQSVRMALVVLLYPALMALFAGRGGHSAFDAALPAEHAAGLALLLAGGVLVAAAGSRIGLANAAMLAPCLLAMGLSAGDALPSSVPRWLVDVAQLVMGASLGMQLAREGLGGAPRRLALAAFVAGVGMVALLTVAGLTIGWLAGLPLRSVVLGLAPGGMPEMVVTAQALHLAVPLVFGFHLLRMVMCNLLVGPLWRAAVALRVLR